MMFSRYYYFNTRNSKKSVNSVTGRTMLAWIIIWHTLVTESLAEDRAS